MKLLRAAPLLAIAVAGCSDTPSGPAAQMYVHIQHASIALEERTLQVGETVQLEASLTNAAGKPVSGSAITWRSTVAEVATVDATGLVTARSEGVALVIATSGAVADTARINVAAPVSGTVACAPGQAPLRLGVGEAHTTTADRAVTLCIDGAGGAEYALIPFNGSRITDSRSALSLEIAASGVVPTTTALTEQSPLALLGASAAAPHADDRLHRQLRERARPALERRMRALHAAGASGFRPSLSALPPEPGQRMRINVETSSSDGCSAPVYRTGRVVAVTQRAVIVADSANPQGFSDAEYRAFGEQFDQVIYPLDVEMFGEPSDLDKNARVVVFFTSAVNDLTPPGGGYYYAGFFYDRDLFPRSGDNSCAGSNEAELFYMMVPDETRANAGENAYTRAHVREHTPGVLAHEFQHLINASRRLHVNRAPVWEEDWLNEGLSHIAEELMFYRVSGLGARANHGPATLQGARESFRAFQLPNIDRLTRYLTSPQTGSPMADDDELSTRGATWSFLRYAADRRGGTERSLWRALADSRTAGLTNLAAALGQDPIQWMNDWSVSLYVDDTSVPQTPAYSQSSWNLRAVYPSLMSLGGTQSYSRFPLRLVGVGDTQPLSLRLRSGGAAFVRFGVPAGTRAAIRTTSGTLPAPSSLRLTLVRTK